MLYIFNSLSESESTAVYLPCSLNDVLLHCDSLERTAATTGKGEKSRHMRLERGLSRLRTADLETYNPINVGVHFFRSILKIKAPAFAQLGAQHRASSSSLFLLLFVRLRQGNIVQDKRDWVIFTVDYMRCYSKSPLWTCGMMRFISIWCELRKRRMINSQQKRRHKKYYTILKSASNIKERWRKLH